MSSAIDLALTRDLLESIADEMAAVCMRTAVSPNIKDRRDLSAAVFDGDDDSRLPNRLIETTK